MPVYNKKLKSLILNLYCIHDKLYLLKKMSNTSNNPSQNTAIGPFTKESFNQAKWKHNRERIYLLNSTNEEETIPEVQFYLQFLHELNACDDYNQYFGETSIKNYFFDDLLPSNAKNLIGCKFFNNAQLLELSNACFEQMIIFWLKALPEDHPKLAEMAKVILDPTRTYYKFNNQENVSTSVVVSLFYQFFVLIAFI